jgi:hypothetical protein
MLIFHDDDDVQLIDFILMALLWMTRSLPKGHGWLVHILP